jgi:hypothetical protein
MGDVVVVEAEERGPGGSWVSPKSEALGKEAGFPLGSQPADPGWFP